jgi:hypothetical protein
MFTDQRHHNVLGFDSRRDRGFVCDVFCCCTSLFERKYAVGLESPGQITIYKVSLTGT